jgi:hypothetical protein
MVLRNPWLHFYWIEFGASLLGGHEEIGWLHKVCGVTAFTLDDALYLVSKQVCDGRSLPPVRTIIEDVNLATLDPGHVRPHIGVPIFRGVWFPRVDSQGYRKGWYPDISPQS